MASTGLRSKRAERQHTLRRSAGEPGHRLEHLLHGHGVLLLHDARLARGSAATIDHIAVGPGGVTVIENKKWEGKVQVRSEGGLLRPRESHLVVAGQRRPRAVDALIRRMDTVRTVVGYDVDVRGAFCLVGTNGLPLFERLEVQGILIANERGVARLVRRKGLLNAGAIQRIAHRLALAFPSS
jgi:hypothetical protein